MKRTIATCMVMIGCYFVGNAQIEITSEPKYQSMEDMLEYSKTLVRRPYRSGAEGPYAFDCSGFSRYCYKQLGITLKRSSKEQSEYGKKIRASRLRPGDLVFYKGSTGKEVGHVGIVLNKTGKKTFEFIHASSSVGITITSSEVDYFASRYVGARRITTDKFIAEALGKEGNSENISEQNATASTKELKRRRRKGHRDAEIQSDSIKEAEGSLKNSKDSEKQNIDKTQSENKIADENKKKPKAADKTESERTTKVDIHKNDKKQESSKQIDTKEPATEVKIESPQKEEVSITPRQETKAKTYVVKQGDTLYSIARNNGCSVVDIQKWNNLSGNAINIGQTLIVGE